MPGFVSRVEELEVFQRAYAVAGGASGEPRVSADRAVCLGRPSAAGIQIDLRQPRRGFGRQRLSRPEFGRFLMMAIGSADEMQVWTMYCRDLGYIGPEMAERWQGEYREIARMLWGLRRGSSDH